MEDEYACRLAIQQSEDPRMVVRLIEDGGMKQIALEYREGLLGPYISTASRSKQQEQSASLRH
jgi:hypothetical protein